MIIILFCPSRPALSMIRLFLFVGTGKRLNGGLYTPIQPFSRFFLYKGTRQNVGILKKCKLYYQNRPGGPALSMISFFFFLNSHSMASWRRIPGVRFPKANGSCIWQQSRLKFAGFYGGESAM
jgi:hypothetical protein